VTAFTLPLQNAMLSVHALMGKHSAPLSDWTWLALVVVSGGLGLYSSSMWCNAHRMDDASTPRLARQGLGSSALGAGLLSVNRASS
jgi:hypothetical protein